MYTTAADQHVMNDAPAIVYTGASCTLSYVITTEQKSQIGRDQLSGEVSVPYRRSISVANAFSEKTRGPRAFYRSPDNQQQTVQSEKRQPE